MQPGGEGRGKVTLLAASDKTSESDIELDSTVEGQELEIRHEVRRVIVISNMSKDLKNGDVYFEPIYRYKEDSSAEEPYWDKFGELK